MSETESTSAPPELRYVVAPLTYVEVRDPSSNPDNTWTMAGYAAVYNQQTTLYDGKFVRLTESIAPTFFDSILREQPMGQPEGVVHFNLGHDMNRAVASTDVPAGQPGSLTLKSDANGLGYLARVPRDDPDGVAMAVKMRTGVIRQSSFAFTVANAETTYTENDDGPDEEHRTLLEGKHLYDVCACPQGAYSQTVSGLRSYAAVLGQPDLGGHPRQPDLGGAFFVSSTSGSGTTVTVVEGGESNTELEELREEAARRVFEARLKFKPRRSSLNA